MPDRSRSRTSARTAVVWQVLRASLDELATDRDRLDVLDAGGGSGGFAVPVAQLGHTVTVVDQSPDSLAALERRAAEAGVSGRVHGRQGDLGRLLDVVPAAAYDLVLCHSVLEVVDDPGDVLAAVHGALRPGGVVSVLTANRVAAVLSRAVTGRFTEALALVDDPHGRAGREDPLARRFTRDELCALLEAGGLRPGPVHGIRVFTDLVPGALLDDPATVDSLVALEQRLAEEPALRDVATQLHVLARVA